MLLSTHSESCAAGYTADFHAGKLWLGLNGTQTVVALVPLTSATAPVPPIDILYKYKGGTQTRETALWLGEVAADLVLLGTTSCWFEKFDLAT